jgi:hypothetical protein
MIVYLLYLLDSGWGWELQHVYAVESSAECDGRLSGREYKIVPKQVI